MYSKLFAKRQRRSKKERARKDLRRRLSPEKLETRNLLTVLINEILFDPAVSVADGDANGDGVRDSANDEFVEIVNTGVSDVDISGWTLSDDDGGDFAFPASTTLMAGQAAVLFGGGTPTGSFGGALVFTDDGSIGSGLSNSGDLIELKDDLGALVDSVGYGNAGSVTGGSDQSVTRDPDLTGTFTDHMTAAGSGNARFSPGTRIDGSSFTAATESLTVTIDQTSVSESGGTATGTVMRSGSTAGALTVNLGSNDTSEATVPATVEIADGAGSATFTITAVDDSIADGTQTVNITASASGFAGGSESLDVTDDDLGITLDMTLISENGGTTTGTVTRPGSTSGALVVNLASDDTTEATVPASVTIADGSTSATFAVTAVDDALTDGAQTVTITASATGFGDGVVSLDVGDDEAAIVPQADARDDTYTTPFQTQLVVPALTGVLENDVLLYQESFEQAPGSTYTLENAFDDGSFDFFDRFAAPDNGNGARDDFQNGFDGGFAIFGQDQDGTGGDATRTISILGLDISGATGLEATIALGALNSAPTFNNYEGDDGIQIFATIDAGTPMLIGEFAPPAGGPGDLLLDTNADGDGDGTGLTTDLTDFTFEIPGTGTVLDITIDVTSDDSFEPIVVDNVRVGASGIGAAGNVQSPTANNGTVTLNPDGSFTYDPPTAFIGDDTFTYDYTASGDTDTATVTVTVESPSPTFTVTFDATSISENGGTATGTVTRSDGVGSALTVNLASDDTTEATVPASISIADGSDSATFTITAVDDALIDGDQIVTITASATGFDDGSGTIEVADDDVATNVVINESDADQSGTDDQEFVELYDGGVGNTVLTGLVLVLFNGNGDTSYNAFDLDGQMTDADGFFVLGTTNVPGVDLDIGTDNVLQNGADAIGLYQGSDTDFPNGTPATATNLLDSLVYGTDDSEDTGLTAVLGPQFDEGTSGIDSLSRVPDGTGTFVAQAPTPGAANAVDSLTVSIDMLSFSENGGTATGTVTRSTGTTGALTVNLSSDDTTEATVPASVTIPDGSDSATFTITAVDDLVVDGTQTATITASATGFADGTRTIDVLDNDVPTLTLTTALSEISEDGGTSVATVSRNDGTAGAVTVNLSSSDTGEATVPSSVTIPDGSSSVNFTITGVDDTIVDGTQTITITAAATGFVDGTDTIDVTDDDSPVLTVSIDQASISENGGTSTATVTRNTGTSGAITVLLASDDISEATVPSFVTIPDGSDSATFSITAVDDALLDGTQTVTITASLTGFTDGTDTIDIVDDETPSLSIDIDQASISENGGTSSVTVTRNTGTSGVLTVDLASDDTTEATVPSSVTIADGNDSATFTLTAVDDALVDGTQTVTITASAATFADGSDSVEVTDDDVPALTVTIAAGSIAESEGATATTVTISRNTDITSALTVSLSSDDTTEATVPGTTTIAAGQSSVTVDVAAVDDAILDGTQTVTITATATGHADGTDTVDVTDDEILATGLLLNEILFNPPDGDSPNEYIELRGTPNGTIGAGTYLVNIEGDDNDPGDVNEFSDLSGLKFGSNGLLVLLTTGNTYSTDAGAEIALDVTDGDQENVSNTFFLIESATPPTNDDDIDDNDDGTPDGAVFGGWTILDGVSILDDDDRDGGGSDFGEYGYASLIFAENVGVGTLLFTPADASIVDTGPSAANYVGRIGNSAGSAPMDWVAGGVEGTIPNLNLIAGETIPPHLGLSPLDHIGAPNVFTPPLTLTLDIDLADISENGGSATATVSRTAADISADLIVNLASNDTTEATVPATVTIPGGSASTTFAITAVDDAIVDGTQTVTITASAASFADGTDTIDVTDDDVNVLTVAIDQAQISENSGTSSVTVTRTGTSGNLTVDLASDDTTEATVPASVTIADGSDSATFTVTAVDDAIVDGTQTVTITASASGFIDGTDTVEVTDDESAGLTVTIAAASISEDAGAAATTVTISRNTDTTNALTVNLSSDDTSEAAVQTSATIAAGQSSVTVDIDAVDDALFDGTQAVTITATASGHADGTDTVDVTDDEFASTDLLINEVLIDPPGSDTGQEYFELRGTPNDGSGPCGPGLGPWLGPWPAPGRALAGAWLGPGRRLAGPLAGALGGPWLGPGWARLGPGVVPGWGPGWSLAGAWLVPGRGPWLGPWLVPGWSLAGPGWAWLDPGWAGWGRRFAHLPANLPSPRDLL